MGNEEHNDEMRRLEALRLAHCELMDNKTIPSEVIERAKIYYEFLAGKKE